MTYTKQIDTSVQLHSNIIHAKEFTMGKTVENPKKYIISCRINDEEMQVLQDLSREQGTSISTLLRQSLLMLDQGAIQDTRLSA